MTNPFSVTDGVRRAACAAVASIGLAVCDSAAQAAYLNNFEVDTTGSWTVNTSTGTDSATNFFFDYSTVGIPAAPSGAGTRGAKLQANQTSGVFGGVSASPTGLTDANPANDYVLTFDWWANFNGPFPAGGSGSTMLSTFGVGTDGVSAQSAGVADSVFFAATGDGNSSSDWRAYSPTANTRYTDDSGVYAADNVAGSSNASHAYYAGFGGASASAAQLALFPQQTGTTGAGASGMEWHQVEIEKIGNTITWTVDGLLIATIAASDDTALGGANIFFGHADTNTTSSTDANDTDLLFTLIDNVALVPEPTSAAVLGLAALGLLGRRRRGA